MPTQNEPKLAQIEARLAALQRHTGTRTARILFDENAPADIAALMEALEEAKVFARQFLAISEELHGTGPCSVCDSTRAWLDRWREKP